MAKKEDGQRLSITLWSLLATFQPIRFQDFINSEIQKIIMRRYNRRYARYPKPQYAVNRKYNSSGLFTVHSVEPTIYLATQRLVCTSRDSGNDAVLDSPATVKHITVDIQTIPTIVDVSSQGADKVVYFPPCGWLCVFVPAGTKPVEPFSATDGTIYNTTLYEPQNYVLGSGTISQGSTAVVPVVGKSESPYGVLGTTLRESECRSKKLNPGDSIYMIYYLLNVPTKTSDIRDITPMDTIVTYCVKY